LFQSRNDSNDEIGSQSPFKTKPSSSRVNVSVKTFDPAQLHVTSVKSVLECTSGAVSTVADHCEGTICTDLAGMPDFFSRSASTLAEVL
jgi:hypothetical protein